MKPSFIYFILLFFLSNNLFSQTSILDNGDWFKIAVVESGVFKIDKNFFEKNNISIDNVDPKKIQVYGKGKNVRDWTHVRDTSRAIYKIMTKGKIGETYNISGNN